MKLIISEDAKLHLQLVLLLVFGLSVPVLMELLLFLIGKGHFEFTRNAYPFLLPFWGVLVSAGLIHEKIKSNAISGATGHKSWFLREFYAATSVIMWGFIAWCTYEGWERTWHSHRILSLVLIGVFAFTVTYWFENRK